MAKKSEGTKEFLKALTEYLDALAYKDERFREVYRKPGKSIQECGNFVVQEVKKKNKSAFADNEIFGLAVHYYEEDNINVSTNEMSRATIISAPSKDTVHSEVVHSPTPKSPPKKQQAPDGVQQSLF
jgi:hypothetical protein